MDYEWGRTLGTSSDSTEPYLEDGKLVVPPGTKGLGPGSRSFLLLRLLMDREGDLVSHAEIGEAVWENED